VDVDGRCRLHRVEVMAPLENAEAIGKLAINDLPRIVGDIYGTKDELRSLWDVWLHANHHAAAIARAAGKPRLQGRILTEIADLAFWLFTIIYRVRGELGVKGPGEDDRQSIIRVKEDLSGILWNRHPGLCPSCYWRGTRTEGPSLNPARPGVCKCAAHPGDQPDGRSSQAIRPSLRGLALMRVDQRPKSIDQWQERFNEIYRDYLQTASLERIILELLTQMGEVSDGMVRMYTYKPDEFVAPIPSWRRERLEDELGDLFRWLFLIVAKLNSLISSSSHDLPRSAPEPLRLSWILWDRYGSSTSQGQLHCPFCGEPTCTCRHIFVPGNASAAELVERAADGPNNAL
jgi:NTP pyrophosphatase (non-canonical NTP hydrolase)